MPEFTGLHCRYRALAETGLARLLGVSRSWSLLRPGNRTQTNQDSKPQFLTTHPESNQSRLAIAFWLRFDVAQLTGEDAVKLFFALLATILFSFSAAHARGYSYGGGHHSASHGGHYSGGSGSSHRGGHYGGPHGGYGTHK
jgi:hypothetical protein